MFEKVLKSTVMAVTALAVTAGTSQAAALELSGSTTVQKRIIEPLSAELAKATGLSVSVRGVGSGGGFEELMEGVVEASLASSPLESLLDKYDLPDDGTYREHILTMDLIVPIVHATNPVQELTWQQLSDINTGVITNWQQVGGEDCEIKVVTSHSGSATRKVFQSLVMNGASYVETAKTVKSTRQEVGRVAKSPCGIGAVSKSFVDHDKNAKYVNEVSTDPIVRPLSIITKGKPSPDVKKLISFLMTPTAQRKFR